jgi:adenine-specific DNA-methyltransferase
LLPKLIPGRKFPFPKSLYAVEDALRFFVSDKPDAVVLDFFAGSGTTAHAVARLNRQDGGRRQCLLVTNNEVSDQEALALTAQGHRPGEDAWEALGICEYVTKPRVRAALTGQTHLGEPVTGAYGFTDLFPMSEGLQENAQFFSLTYEDPDLISLGRSFEAIAPLLWLKAGGCGAILETVVEPWALTPDARYAVLFDTDQWREFVDEVSKRNDLTHIFVVTDSEAAFQQVVGELPRRLGRTQLYEDYLHNFQINTRGRR